MSVNDRANTLIQMGHRSTGQTSHPQGGLCLHLKVAHYTASTSRTLRKIEMASPSDRGANGGITGNDSEEPESTLTFVGCATTRLMIWN